MDGGNTTDDDSRGQGGGSRALNAGGPLLKDLRQGRGWSQRDEALLLKQLADVPTPAGKSSKGLTAPQEGQRQSAACWFRGSMRLGS